MKAYTKPSRYNLRLSMAQYQLLLYRKRRLRRTTSASATKT